MLNWSGSVSVPFRGSYSEIKSTIPCMGVFDSVSVPFRGSYSEILVELASLLSCRESVSVPFRGSYSEILWHEYLLRKSRKSFPSPFGVRILKFTPLRLFHGLLQVSVPFRGSYSEIDESITDYRFKEIFAKFPSPFGVRILKFNSNISLQSFISSLVSVPFRGSYSEISTSRNDIVGIIDICFRPLSGFVF